MRWTEFALAAAVWAALAPWVSAQSKPRNDGTLLERFDNFTSSLFTGKERPRSPAPHRAPAKPTTQAVATQATPSPAAKPADETIKAESAPVQTAAPITPAAPAATAAPVAPPTVAATPQAEEPPMAPGSTETPLHTRLAAFRNSPFGNPKPSGSAEKQGDGSPASAGTGETVPQPRTGGAAEPAAAVPLGPVAPAPAAPSELKSEAAAAPAIAPAAPAAEPAVPSVKPETSSILGPSKPAEGPRVAQRPGTVMVGPTMVGPTMSAPVMTAPVMAAPIVAGPSLGPAVGPTLAPQPTRAPGDNGVFVRQSPVLAVETVGPKRISVGKEAAYEIQLRNSGEIAADQVVLTIEIPSWTEVTGAEASVGSTTPALNNGTLQWKVGRLEARGREKLNLRLIPRQSRPFDLAVKWDCTPANANALIEVQEPKLVVSLLGPREVLFGKGEIYKLEVFNSGNGDAENVVVSLAPNGGERKAAANHVFGRLSAGQKRSIDVELTARQMGKLTIAIEARGDGGMKTELSEEILVRRAALKVDIDAPRVQYVGAETAYRIRVSNPGTAPAIHPVVTATLPAGAKFVSSPQNGRAGSEPNKIVWTLENLPAGSETTLVMVSTMASAGTGRFDVQCVAEGDLATQASAVTQAEATANLALSVEEPSGPVQVGGDANYQLTLVNRGTAAAENVEVVVYFSNGLEPSGAEGAKNRLGAGQVVFDLIPRITSGQSVALKIRAKAQTPGNHIYRVEIHAKTEGTRLVREGTTRFYGAGDTQPASVTPRLAPTTAAGPGASRQ